MRTSLLLLPLAGLGVLASGCLDKEAADPSQIIREESPALGARSRPTPATPVVRCACDAEGGLHVQAPAGSRITTADDPNPAAEIVLDDLPEGGPIRRTRSLGFIGDGKLTPTTSRGGPWNVPDGLLPIHRHPEPRYGAIHYGGHRGYGGGYGFVQAPSGPRVAR